MAATFRAISRNVKMSPRKVRLVVDMIRGKSVPKALETLAFTDKRAAYFVNKALRSAVANASRDEAVDPDRLVVSAAMVNEGPRFKGRFLPRPRGMATPITPPTCHIHLEVSEPARAETPSKGVTPAVPPSPVEST